jgi:hypothetical protein
MIIYQIDLIFLILSPMPTPSSPKAKKKYEKMFLITSTYHKAEHSKMVSTNGERISTAPLYSAHLPKI